MLFELNVIGINSKKKETLGDFSKSQVLEIFDDIPWEKIVRRLEENESTEEKSPSFGIVNKSDNYGLIVAPIYNEGWIIYFKQELVNKSLFGLMKNKSMIITEKRKQDLKIAKKCIDLFLNQDYLSLDKICEKMTFSK